MAPRNIFSRKGPWVLVAAVCLYMAGNLVLDRRFTEQSRALEKDRFATERIGVAQITAVSIAIPNASYEQSIDIQYDDQAHVTVGYDKLTTQVQNHAENKTLHITLGVVSSRNYHGRNYHDGDRFTLVLPTTITTLILKNKAHGQVTTSSNKPTQKLAALNIFLDDCESSAQVAGIEVDALRLSRACGRGEASDYRSVMFALEGTQVKKLDVLMHYGVLTVTPKSSVDNLSLTVADEVVVNAPANVLRKARWARAPVATKVH